MSKKTFAFIIILFILALGGAYYWFFMRSPVNIDTDAGNDQGNTSLIFGSNPVSTHTSSGGIASSSTATTGSLNAPIAILRELSTTPVGGMAASTTASSTILRWIDRGVGRVYQAYSNSNNIDELSNTTIPRVYDTFWDKNADAFILQSLADDSDGITSIFATLFPLYVPNPTSGSSTVATSSFTTTPYELRGAQLPSGISDIAVNPEGNKVITFESAQGGGTNGYVSDFNGSKLSQVLTTPLTQINVAWPTDNVIAITTKASSNANGFLYFVNPKNGIFNKILGNVRGLSTLTSKDASMVLYNTTVTNGVQSAVYNIKAATSENLIFNTLPEKCVWSGISTTTIFCAVPAFIPPGNYPDAWYQGSISFSDSIWEVDAVTGSAHIIADLSTAAGKNIDAIDLTLDPKENYLYFINKKDLSLWSLQLNN